MSRYRYEEIKKMNLVKYITRILIILFLICVVSNVGFANEITVTYKETSQVELDNVMSNLSEEIDKDISLNLNKLNIDLDAMSKSVER